MELIGRDYGLIGKTAVTHFIKLGRQITANGDGNSRRTLCLEPHATLFGGNNRDFMPWDGDGRVTDTKKARQIKCNRFTIGTGDDDTVVTAPFSQGEVLPLPAGRKL